MWLKIQPEGTDQLTFTWGNTRGPYPCIYQVGRKAVVTAAARIREILEKLAKWSQLKDPVQLHRLLRDLANEGMGLRFIIFDCPEKAADILVLQDWIAEQFSAGDDELAITADSNLYIPWGFVFDGDTAAVGNAGDYTDCAQFWSLKFKLSMVFSASGRPAKCDRPLESYKLLSIINPAVLLGADKAVRDELLDLFKERVGVAHNLEHCEKLVLEAARNDTLIHFLGHCKDGELILGDERIDPTRFKMMVEKLLARREDRSCPYNLIFLNACETLTGELDESFRNAAARPGLCGIVATEASVPQAFAADFGLRFLKSMLVDGNSIGDTMEKLRRDPKLWPLNLLYSCYAYADYRITR
jgi:hypothetical protein